MRPEDDWGAYCICGSCEYCRRRARELRENDRRKLRDALNGYSEAQATAIVAEYYKEKRDSAARCAEIKRDAEMYAEHRKIAAASYAIEGLKRQAAADLGMTHREHALDRLRGRT